MFSKPKVGVTFAAGDELAYSAPEPVATLWAHNTARRIAIAVLLAILCVVAYSTPIAVGEELPADRQNVLFNPVLYNLIGYRTIWLSPQHLPQFSPVSYSFLLLEHQFFQNPRGYRVISLLIHIANVLLLLHLLNRLELPGAWVGAAAFALHPVQVDAVCWISQQRYLFCALFYISALLIYLRRAGLNPVPPPPLPGTEPLIRIALPESATALYVLSMLLFVLALLSHILAATFPLIVLIMVWWERGLITRNDIKPLILPAAISIAVIVLMTYIDISHTGQLWGTFAGWKWFIEVGRGLWTGAVIIALPFTLSYAHPRWDQVPFHVWQLGFPVAAVFVLGSLWHLRNRWGRGAFASAAMFCVLLLPAAFGANDSGDLPGITIAEHQLYLASAALLVPAAALVVAWLMSKPKSADLLYRPGVAPTAAIVVGVLLTITSAVHSSAYTNTHNVWEQAIRGDGDSVVAHNQLGLIEIDEKELGKAESHFRDALIADPTQTDALFNLAHVAEARGDLSTAIGLYYKILLAQPNDINAHFGLAQAYISQGLVADGLAEYDKVLKLRPRFPDVFNNLGLVYARQGEGDRAIEQYRKALQIDPKMTAAYLNMANVQFQAGKYLEAKDSLQEAIKIDPHNYVIWMNAGVMATTVGDLDSGEKYFRAAVYYNPKSPDPCVDLGMVLIKQSAIPGKKSRLDEAIGYFKRATVLDPSNVGAQHNLADAERRRDHDGAVSTP